MFYNLRLIRTNPLKVSYICYMAQRLYDKRKLFGAMDQDSDPRFVQNPNYRYALNIINGKNEDDTLGVVRNIKGNTLVSTTLPTGTNIVIGAFEDKEKLKMYYFLHNSNNDHTIFEYDIDTGTIQEVVQDSILNFSTDNPIMMVDIIELEEDNNLMKWVDGRNEARQIQIERAIANNYPSPLLESHITVIRPYPPNSPTYTYQEDSTILSNNLKRALFKFRTQFVYDTMEPSTWSPFSKLTLPQDLLIDDIIGDGNGFPNRANRLDVVIETGDATVRQINIGVSIDDGRLGLVAQLDKDELSIPDNSTYTYEFFNNIDPLAIPDAQQDALYDFVPRIPQSQAYIDTIMTYGNFREGRDNVDLNVSVTVNYDDIPDGTSTSSLDITDWTTNGAIDLGTTDSRDAVVNRAGSPPAYEIWDMTFNRNPGVSMTISIGFGTNASEQDIAQAFIDNFNGQTDVTFDNVTASLSGTDTIVVTADGGAVGVTFDLTANSIVAYEGPIKSFKRNATHSLGIIYHDAFGRLGTVQNTDDLNFFVEPQWNVLATQRGKAYPSINISHAPPTWATGYYIAMTANESIARNPTGYAGFVVTKIASASASGGTRTLGIDDLFDYNNDVVPGGGILSYDFTPGDRIRVLQNATPAYVTTQIDLEILSYDSGNQDITVRDDSNMIIDTDFICEIYTPKKGVVSSDQNIYFQLGRRFDIVTDVNSNRVHAGSTQDQIIGVGAQPAIITLDDEGDVYLRFRPDDGVLAVAPDTYVEDYNAFDQFRSNFYDRGKPNRIDKTASETRREATVRYSGQFFPDTNINGLSTFLDGNFEDYDKNYGSIQRMYTENARIIVFQELKVGQIFVNENILLSATGNPAVQTSDTVLYEKMQYYSGEYGISRNPESFAVYGMAKYFTDSNRQAVLRLSGDGITNISRTYNTHSLFSGYFREINQQSTRTLIKGAYDITNGHYVVNLPNLGGSFPSQTLVFDEEKNGWTSFFSYIPDWMIGITNRLITFGSGGLYTHETNTTRNNFYGVQYNSEIDVVSNIEPDAVKTYDSIDVLSNSLWLVPEATNLGGQETDMSQTSDWQDHEGVYKAAYWFDKNTPNVSNPVTQGDVMRGHELTTKLQNTSTDQVELYGVHIRCTTSELTNR